MNATEFYEKTKCPYCKTGFLLMQETDRKVAHIDIAWHREAGQIFECQDPQLAGTLLESTTSETVLKELNARFHADPSPYSKENVSLQELYGLIGEYVRYAEYMDDHTLLEDEKGEEVLIQITDRMYEEGKNIKEIIEAITKPDEEVQNK